MNNTTSLYIHIPFCHKACHYCSFYFSLSTHRKNAYLHALKKEIQLRKSEAKGREVISIYLGGGTPSLLSISDLSSILDEIHQHFNLKKGLEISIETNPENVLPEYIKGLYKIGINRLSIGIQSFNEVDLQTMNRSHSVEQARNALENATKLFDNISIDLMFGLPYADMSVWKENLKTALAYQIKHISTYNLTIEEKTKLHQLVKNQAIQVVPDDLLNEMYTETINELTQEGFIHYEISNFAKPKYESIHNQVYWYQGHYIGFGPSAHSYNGHERRENKANLKMYIDGIDSEKPFFEIETLTKNNLYNEYILTRLRTNGGIKLNEVNALFGAKFVDILNQAIAPFLAENYIEKVNSSYLLTDAGKPIANHISMNLMNVD